MKRILFVLTVLGFNVLNIQAQNTKGTITFEQKTNMHKIIPAEMQQYVPEYRTSKHLLLFKDSISLYKAAPVDESENAFGGEGGGGRTMVVGGFGGGGGRGFGGGEKYINLNSKIALESMEIGAKDFIIIDTIKALKWKLSAETKEILGYTCKKATATTKQTQRMSIRFGANADTTKKDTITAPKDITVEAWFTDKLTAGIGPDVYIGLPGAVLEINVDNGANVYKAIEISADVKEKEMKKPTKGKQYTKEEFAKMMEERMKNFQPGQGRPGGGMIRMGTPM